MEIKSKIYKSILWLAFFINLFFFLFVLFVIFFRSSKNVFCDYLHHFKYLNKEHFQDFYLRSARLLPNATLAPDDPTRAKYFTERIAPDNKHYPRSFLRLPWVNFRSQVLDRFNGYVIIDRFFIRYGRTTGKRDGIEEPFATYWTAGLSVGKNGSSGRRKPFIYKRDNGRIQVAKGSYDGKFYFMLFGVFPEPVFIDDDGDYTNKPLPTDRPFDFNWVHG